MAWAPAIGPKIESLPLPRPTLWDQTGKGVSWNTWVLIPCREFCVLGQFLNLRTNCVSACCQQWEKVLTGLRPQEEMGSTITC